MAKGLRTKIAFACLMLFVNNGMYDNRIYSWPMLFAVNKLR